MPGRSAQIRCLSAVVSGDFVIATKWHKMCFSWAYQFAPR